MPGLRQEVSCFLEVQQKNAILGVEGHLLVIYFIMNEDQKYDGFLLDLISLLQEAVIRFLSKKTLDVHKFQHYFEHIYAHMLPLEEKFHSQAKKITRHVTKLKKFLGREAETARARADGSPQHQNNQSDRPIEPPNVTLRTAYKSVYGSRELKSIAEVEEDHQFKMANPSKRRSETANGYRQKIMENTRPMTGQNGKNRYKNNKTIQVPTNPLTQQPQHYTISHHYQQSYQKERRKDFYDQLEKMKDKDEKGLSPVIYSLPFRKKSRSQRKWTHKIGRLL